MNIWEPPNEAYFRFQICLTTETQECRVGREVAVSVSPSNIDLEKEYRDLTRLFTSRASIRHHTSHSPSTTIMTSMPLEISPAKELQIPLSHDGTRSLYCTLSLRHPGKTCDHVAFKVRVALCLNTSFSQMFRIKLMSFFFRVCSLSCLVSLLNNKIGQN